MSDTSCASETKSLSSSISLPCSLGLAVSLPLNSKGCITPESSFIQSRVRAYNTQADPLFGRCYLPAQATEAQTFLQLVPTHFKGTELPADLLIRTPAASYLSTPIGTEEVLHRHDSIPELWSPHALMDRAGVCTLQGPPTKTPTASKSLDSAEQPSAYCFCTLIC